MQNRKVASMKPLSTLICLLALAALSCSRAPRSCPVCRREECRGFAFRILLANGKTLDTCCPRCGLEYLHAINQQARTMAATDFNNGKWVDAAQAVYVMGSDVSHCSMNEAQRDAYGCCYYKSFDRCEPSVLAFASKEEAQAFTKLHNGRLLDYEDLRAEVERLSIPNNLKQMAVE